MTETVKIKICGLRIPSDVDAVNQALPDMTGFIFDSTRRRYIDPKDAEILRQSLDPSIEPIGVFVNATPQEIADVLSICKVTTIQLHGQESYDDIESIRKANPNVQIIKAYKVDTADNLDIARNSPADIVLLDHGIGGTGESFDWSLLKNFERPFILAGGISADNAALAIQLTNPYALDASSSVETDGHKDAGKVLRLVQTIRGNH